MSNTIILNIITPGRLPITEEIISLTTENSDGKIQFMGGHAPIISSTVPTITKIKTVEGIEKDIFTSTGIVRVKSKVIDFCIDSMNFKDEIDFSRAKEAKKRAEKRLKERKDIDILRAEKALERANARIKLVEEFKC